MLITRALKQGPHSHTSCDFWVELSFSLPLTIFWGHVDIFALTCVTDHFLPTPFLEYIDEIINS
jgi:hypothetical protein